MTLPKASVLGGAVAVVVTSIFFVALSFGFTPRSSEPSARRLAEFGRADSLTAC